LTRWFIKSRDAPLKGEERSNFERNRKGKKGLKPFGKGKDRYSVFAKGYDRVRLALIREDITDLPGA